MTVSSNEFRKAMRQWASGVTVVTVQHNGVPRAMLATSFLSVSIQPASILVSIRRDGLTHDLMVKSGSFAVHILRDDQGDMAERLGYANDEDYRLLRSVAYTLSSNGSPILEDCLACLDCRIATTIETVDHTLFIGEVLATTVMPGSPLVHWARAFHALVSE
ncbi:MAG: flavin reductase family protein [Chloroflexi bacterium]|nr:flavin reductase family protein [Chloroflexota bacterium]